MKFVNRGRRRAYAISNRKSLVLSEQEQTSREKKLFNIVKELLETEETYVKVLKLIDGVSLSFFYYFLTTKNFCINTFLNFYKF